MARIPRILVLFPLLAFAAPADAGTPAAVAAAAHAGHAAIAQASAPAGRRWKTDAPLRAGMAHVRIATETLAPLEHGHLDPAQVIAVADQLRSAVNAMFAQCRLAPGPDAALHPILARILAASRALHDAPANPAPLAELRDVMAQYRKLFEEPAVSIAPHRP